jgi:hypothetical protein
VKVKILPLLSEKFEILPLLLLKFTGILPLKLESFKQFPTSENRNLSTFGRSAFNHMRTQNQHNMQSTSNGNVTNLTGSTFPKRPNNLNNEIKKIKNLYFRDSF